MQLRIFPFLIATLSSTSFSGYSTLNTLCLEGLSSNRRGFLVFASLVIIILSLIQLLLKMFQLVTVKIYYILNWVNWLEVALYVCAIVFVSAIRADCSCHGRSQWQVGCIAVFLAWIDLILFIEKLPYAGTRRLKV